MASDRSDDGLHTDPRGSDEAGADQPGELVHGALSRVDAAISTMANIAPAGGVVLAFGAVFAASGIAAPLTVLVATVAIMLLANTVVEFSKRVPSAGSFVTFIGRGLGPFYGLTTAVVLTVGYILGIAAILAATAGFAEMIIHQYLNVHVSWKILAVAFAILSGLVLTAGVKPSTKVVAASFA